MLSWMIIYPQGDRTRLDVAQVRDYQKDEWALASEREFPNTWEGKAEATAYMVELATKHGLQHTDKQQHLLDKED